MLNVTLNNIDLEYIVTPSCKFHFSIPTYNNEPPPSNEPPPPPPPPSNE